MIFIGIIHGKLVFEHYFLCALHLKAGNNKRNKNYALRRQGYLRRSFRWASPISGNIYKERASSLT